MTSLPWERHGGLWEGWGGLIPWPTQVQGSSEATGEPATCSHPAPLVSWLFLAPNPQLCPCSCICSPGTDPR